MDLVTFEKQEILLLPEFWEFSNSNWPLPSVLISRSVMERHIVYSTQSAGGVGITSAKNGPEAVSLPK
jgi:hypothetical protein